MSTDTPNGVDSLVARLQAAIAETEREALGVDGWHGADCGFDQVYHGEPCACAVPDAVLRLCWAHRDLINAYTGAVFTQECHPEYEGNNGYVQAMRDTLRIVARGLGVEEQSSE